MYDVLWAANCFVGSEAPKHNVFDQFWKFNFYFEYISRSTRFLSFDGPSHCLYLFKNHRQTFLWPKKRPSSHLKSTKKWFVPNIKYLSGSFFADFCCREGIFCYNSKLFHLLLYNISFLTDFNWKQAANKTLNSCEKNQLQILILLWCDTFSIGMHP